MAFAGILTAAACAPRGSDLASRFAPPRAEPAALASGARVNFARLESALLAPRCLRCHEEYGTEEGLLRDVVPGDVENSPLYDSMASGRMPPEGSRASDNSLRLVRSYIGGLTARGRKPVPAPAPEPPAVIVTYAALKERVLTPSCTACHQDMDTEEGLRVYVQAGNPDRSALFRSVDRGSMPPGEPLSPEGKDLIRDYILGLK